jgi:hypothetical protein
VKNTARWWAAAASLTVAMATPRASHACASCGCGDPTLTALGSEKPFQNRLRIGATLVVQEESSGAPQLDEIALDEQRLELQAAWAPTARIFLLATLPLFRREVGYVNLARNRVLGTGDLELRAKLFLWEDRAFSTRHLIALVAGARLPTTSWQHDARGAARPSELQGGRGALSPLAGLAYAHFHFPWSEYASVEGSLPVTHQPEFRPPATVLATVAVQWQLGAPIAVRLSADGRWDGHAHEAGRTDPNTGGAVAFISPTLLVTPVTDLVLFALARLPAIDRLAGQQRAGAIFSTGIAYDF